MRWIVPAVCLYLLLPLAYAQLVNPGFEDARPATAPPNPAWSLHGDRLPAGWAYNATYGGPVGVVDDAHTGQHALFLARGKDVAHFLQGPLPVHPGDRLQCSAWVKGGSLQLTFYEYAGDKWLRTVPTVATITAGDQWVQGGGYYLVSDPEVTHVSLVLVTGEADGVLVDDVDLKAETAGKTAGPALVLENQGCRLTLDADGSVRSLSDKATGRELLQGSGAPFFAAVTDNWRLPVTKLERDGKLLKLVFGANQAQATVEVQELPYTLGFKVKSWSPQDLASITLAELTVKKLATTAGSLGATYDDKTAVGLQALHYAGQQRAQAMADTMHFACVFPGRRGLDKAGAALFVCPRERLEKTVEELELAFGLPSPHFDGVWGKLSPLMHRSYFFIHDLSEANVDDVIAWGKRGHFAYIQILEDAWSHGGGTFAINERNFPHGRDGLKAVVAKLHAAGFKVGLHFLSAGMRGTDPLVSPVPNDGLVYDASLPLAGAVDEKADFLPTATPPSQFPAEDGGYTGSGTVLRVDDEIIFYSTVKLDPPYGFVGCRRGYLNSKPTAHAAGAAARHMLKAYGLFLIDADSPLLDQVAQNVAATFKYCNLDGMYYDGSERLQGDHSYYNARIQTAYANAGGKRDLICQGSSFSPYTWHLVSRCASADGYKDIKYYLDERAPSFLSWYQPNLMPIDIGWYGMNPNIRPDDIEYVMSRAIGFNASVSISTGLNALYSTPQSGEMMDLVAKWEDLRLSGRVTEYLRAQLRDKGHEYTLRRRGQDDVLVPITYTDWVTSPAAAGEAEALVLKDPRPEKPNWELQVEAGAGVRPGPGYAQGVPLELFEAEPAGQQATEMTSNQFNPSLHGNRATRQGVTQELSLVVAEAQEGKTACRFRATSTLTERGGWATFGKAFDPPLNLGNYGVIGLWVKGDAKGEALKVQLWDTEGKPQDQYLTIDFTGWRYVELPRPEPAPVDYTKIARLQFYYNNMPAKDTCECLLDGVKVLAQATVLTNPEVRVGETRLVFPVTMASGDRLIVRTGGEGWLYRRGQDKEPLSLNGQLPEFSEGLTVTAAPNSHALRLRAALSWPERALVVPAGR